MLGPLLMQSLAVFYVLVAVIVLGPNAFLFLLTHPLASSTLSYSTGQYNQGG